MRMTIMCTGIYFAFDFFHFQKKYKPTPDRAYIPMNIYIGFTLSPKRYAMRRLKPVLNYFSSFTNDDLITFLPSSNMMVRLALFPTAISVIVPSPKTLCLTLSPMSKSAIYLFLLIYPQTTRMANMMMIIMCTGMPNICYSTTLINFSVRIHFRGLFSIFINVF